MPMRLSRAGSLGHRACRVARFRIVRCSSAVSKPVATDALTQSATAKQEAGNKPETGLILDLGIPTLLPEWRKMFAPSTVVTDVTAGITVGCVAVPLSLAIAVASGVPPEVGLVSAAVAGVAGGLMGGTTLAITGPAAAISLLVCEAVQTHGLGTLPFITLACGGLQLAMGVARGGGITKYVPESVIAGGWPSMRKGVLVGTAHDGCLVPADRLHNRHRRHDSGWPAAKGARPDRTRRPEHRRGAVQAVASGIGRTFSEPSPNRP